MKVEKISPNKFKLTFSDEDLKDFGVDFENLRYNSEDAQELFWNLIERADIEEEFFKDERKKMKKQRNITIFHHLFLAFRNLRI